MRKKNTNNYNPATEKLLYTTVDFHYGTAELDKFLTFEASFPIDDCERDETANPDHILYRNRNNGDNILYIDNLNPHTMPLARLLRILAGEYEYKSAHYEFRDGIVQVSHVFISSVFPPEWLYGDVLSTRRLLHALDRIFYHYADPIDDNDHEYHEMVRSFHYRGHAQLQKRANERLRDRHYYTASITEEELKSLTSDDFDKDLPF